MNKRFLNIFLSILLCMGLLVTTISNAFAQTPTQATSGVVTLADIGNLEIGLNGPFDSNTISFGMPADWKFTGDAQLVLIITTALSSPASIDGSLAYGGVLTVSFNQINVATLTLNKVGRNEYPITIPFALLVSPRLDGLLTMRFALNSGVSCQANQHMNVVIDPSTKITFQFEEQKPSTALSNFPRPIVQSSIYPDQAQVVIPDNPTAVELQSAFTVIAGLGNLSSSTLELELVTISQLTDVKKAATHLIFVGKAASFSMLSDLGLPLVAQKGVFKFASGDQDNGVIEMVNSPWAVKNVVLVVSGNTDSGTLKAAQAVSTGVFQENTAPNLAIVESIKDTVAPVPPIVDPTFADLGYSAHQFTYHGVDAKSYYFYMPSGSSLSIDAYIELAYGHSALLDYSLSGIVVLLNNQPIGSVRFNDTSAGQAINRTRVTIPPNVVIPGNNRIEIRADLNPLDNCSDPELGGLWAQIWPESRFHLPFVSTSLNTQVSVGLNAFPAPMIFDSTLGTTAVIFHHKDLESWRSFARVAGFLGDRSNGAITKLGVFFDDELTGVDLSKYNLIVVGRPSQLSIMDKLDTTLPVSFEKNSDNTKGKFLQVTYQIPPEVPIGYVELMPSPWNSEKVLIATLGNSVTGVNWGISSLVDTPMRSQLAGNFAVINNNRIQTIDTRLVVPVVNTPIALPAAADATPAPQATPTPESRESPWLIPALVIAILLIVIVIVIAIYTNFQSTRRGRNR